VKLLNLESCSVLTTQGLESIILSWPDLERLTVISCNNIKDEELSPALSSLFSSLKELKWRPDTKSMLSANLASTGMGKKGGRFFKRVCTSKLNSNIMLWYSIGVILTAVVGVLSLRVAVLMFI
jgi:hypothetical protein